MGAVLAWLSLTFMSMPAVETSEPAMQGMPYIVSPVLWAPSYAFMVCAMWAIMMVAMMLPSAAPMILLYARVAARAPRETSMLAPTFVFAGTYVALWSVFAVIATSLQWALSGLHVVSDVTMAVGDRRIGGALLLVTGLYQLTPLKRICLDNCRSPLSFLTARWRPGINGAVRLGLAHGAYCVGCCWLLMALLFVGGVMNLIWVAAIAIIVLIEKTVPFGDRDGRIAGGLAILAGLTLIVVPTLV